MLKIIISLMIIGYFLAIGCGEEDKTLVPDHSNVPGVIIEYSPASSGRYIGSPSIAVLPNGDYIASNDFFGDKAQKNRSRIHKSTDKGKSWITLTDLEGQWWSSLFMHKGVLYIFGTSEQRGNVVIRRSEDGGKTWTETSDQSGILLSDSKYHCAPVPVVFHDGRIWRAFEDHSNSKWGVGFQPFVMSAPIDADFLNPTNWTISNKLEWGDWAPYSGWLEGNIVVTPEGRLVNILRVDERDNGGKAAVVEVADDGKAINFDPHTGFFDFPGGCKKFTIRYDEISKQYWSLTNWIHPDDVGKWNPERTRNTVALISSEKLFEWSVKSVVLRSTDYEKTGFQYVDWLFEGDDIIAVSRTAFDDGVGGAHNSHDANYMTFHRIEDFRLLKLSELERRKSRAGISFLSQRRSDAEQKY